MTAWVAWLLVGLGFGAVAARRPVAAALVAAQTVLVGVAALAMTPGRSGEFALAAALLLLKAVVVGVILAVGISRTKEARPHDEETGFLVRLAVTVGMALALAALIPGYGLESEAAESAAAAMLATGLALALVRRATVFAVLAFLVAENGIAVAAVSVSGGLPLVVELGTAFDLVLLIAVAAVFQRRILTAFGTTDSDALRGIRG